jgi:GH43 family beta-xylosidase
MRNDRKINVSFSASAEDYICCFMKVAEETTPNANLVPVFAWHISGKFTNKVTGEVRTFGPGVDVGAIEPEKSTDELIVPIGGLKVAIRLPDEHQSVDRLKFDFLDGSFVVAGN